MSDLWDETQVDRRILAAAQLAPRLPIRERTAVGGTGTYLIRYHGPHPDYEEETVTGQPIYVGSALNFARRVTEHRESLSAVADLDIDHFTVACLHATSHGQALYVEGRLIMVARPPLEPLRLGRIRLQTSGQTSRSRTRTLPMGPATPRQNMGTNGVNGKTSVEVRCAGISRVSPGR